MKWMLRFKFAKPKRGSSPAANSRSSRSAGIFDGEENGCVAVIADCEEADLQGEKEARIMELEKNTGRTWICAGIVKMVRKGGESL